MKNLIASISLVAASAAAYAATTNVPVNASDDPENPTLMSSWDVWDTTTWTTKPDQVPLWKGKNGSSPGASTLANCYITVDQDFTMNQKFLVSGSGGKHSNMNFTLDGTSITFGSTVNNPFDFNGSSYSMGFYFNAAPSSTGTLNFNNTDVAIDLYTTDDSNKKFGRNVSFGEGITANFAGTLSVSGHNSQLTNDSLFSVAGTANVAGNLILTNTIANFSGTVNANTVQMDTADLTLSGTLAPKAGSTYALNVTGGLSKITTSATTALDQAVITVDSGATLRINAKTAGTYNIANASTVRGMLSLYGGAHSSNPSGFIRGNMLVDGGTLYEDSQGGSYALTVQNATVTLQNSATVRVIGVNAGFTIANGGVVTVDATSTIDSANLYFFSGWSSGVEAKLYLSSASNLAQTPNILVNASSRSALTTGKLYLTADSSAYRFGVLQFLRKADFEVHLNGASVEFAGVDCYDKAGQSAKGCVSKLVFYDFMNGLVKLGIDESILSASGEITLPYDYTSLFVRGYAPGSETLLDGEWGIDAGGFLWNSAASYIPEPAEWGLLIGLLAVGLAAYRRRK